MRSPTFSLFTLLLVVGQILSLTSASPLVSDGMHKRFCLAFMCRVDGEPVPAPVAVGTWTPVPYRPSETATATSTPTPVKNQLGADPSRGTGTVLEPSPALPFVTESSSANAGVALSFHGSGPAMALTGLLATLLAV